MKKYDKYKNSGIEWIGEIPEHWEITKMKFLSNTIIDGTHFTPTYISKGIPFLRVTDLQNIEIDLSKTKYISLEEHKSLTKRCKPEKGDVLLSKNGTIGITKVVDWDYEFSVFVSICLIKLKPILTPSFFVYLFGSHVVDLQIKAKSKTTSVTNLHLDQIRELISIVPPIEDQKRINNFLDEKTGEIDEAIALKNQLIALLQEEKSALINEAVTKGIDPTVPMKDSGIEWIGDIPAHWEIKKLKFVAEIIRGKFTHRPRNDKRLYGGKYPFIQTSAVAKTGKYITNYTQTLNDLGYAVSKEFPKGTLTMTIAANIGDVAILDFDACFPDSVVGFMPKKDFIVDFLYYRFGSMKQTFLETAIVNTQLNLNVDRISVLFITCPPKEEQTKIVNFIESRTQEIDQEIDYTKEEIALLKEYRQSLISEAVTGKIDVRK